jgi:murein DD-endopeptidase MepM/ murein hydrolase activator NlpD
MRLLVLAGAWLGAVAPAAALELSLPVDCTIGTDCAVQHYFDRDAGDGTADYMCGHQTYDGHDGLDIRVPDLAAMARGVAVIAAAPGTVRATRDGMADVNVAEAGFESVANVECGNGVMVDHDGGWATQYCHLKEGSIAVRRGDRVERYQA